MTTRARDLSPLITSTFTGLADALERQADATWDLASLCEKWSVREVVAHMTMAARYGPEEFMAEVGADGGDMGATIDRLAARDGKRSPAALLDDLRSEQLHRWEPPGGGQRGALTHVVVHGLDALLPTPITYRPSAEALSATLDVLVDDGVYAHFGSTVDGVRLTATDIDWERGDEAGERIARPAAELVVTLCGRRLP